LIEIPLTVGVLGGVISAALFPVMAAVGLIGAMVAHLTIELTSNSSRWQSLCSSRVWLRRYKDFIMDRAAVMGRNTMTYQTIDNR
jgi:dihydrofolate reductase